MERNETPDDETPYFQHFVQVNLSIFKEKQLFDFNLLLLIAYSFLYSFKHNQKSCNIPFHTDAYTMANNGEMIENGPSC